MTKAPTHPPVEVTESRLGATLYNPFLWFGERLGMARRRRDLLAGARGTVLEIGAGTGLNLRHYPAGLDELVLAEPGRRFGDRIDLDRAPAGVAARLARAPAEELPFEDDQLRHRRLDPGPLHGQRPPPRGRRDSPRPAPRRPPALPRARARRPALAPQPAAPLGPCPGRHSPTAASATARPWRRSNPSCASSQPGAPPGEACPRSSSRWSGAAQLPPVTVDPAAGVG